MSVRRPSRACLTVLLATFTVMVSPPTPIAWSQGATASVGGVVLDESNLPVAAAQVTAQAMASGTTRSTKTGSRGEFELIGLKPGEYTIAAQSSGFDRKEIKVRIELRAEVFNLFNTTNYGTPNRFVNTPQFGTVTTTSTPGRQVQFSMRLRF